MAAHTSPALRVFGWVILFGLLAGLLSCGLAYAVLNRLFVPWQTLPALPEPAHTIRGATIQTVDVETTSGRLLRYDILHSRDGWQDVAAAVNESDNNCERFTSRARPPGDALELRLVCKNYADGGVTTRYALLRDGRITYWSTADHGLEALLVVFLPAVGVPLGLILGLIFGLMRRKQGEKLNV